MNFPFSLPLLPSPFEKQSRLNLCCPHQQLESVSIHYLSNMIEAPDVVPEPGLEVDDNVGISIRTMQTLLSLIEFNSSMILPTVTSCTI